MPKPDKNYVYLAEFARRLSVHPYSVRNAKNIGVFGKNQMRYWGKTWLHWDICSKLYIEHSQKEFVKNDDTGYFMPKPKPKKEKMTPVKEKKKTRTEDIDTEEKEKKPKRKKRCDAKTPKEHMSLVDVKRDKEYYASLKERLRYEELAGNLLRFDDVKREWEKLATDLQRNLLAIPDRICALIAGEVKANKDSKEWEFDANVARSIIDVEIKNTLSSAIPEDGDSDEDLSVDRDEFTDDITSEPDFEVTDDDTSNNETDADSEETTGNDEELSFDELYSDDNEDDA